MLDSADLEFRSAASGW